MTRRKSDLDRPCLCDACRTNLMMLGMAEAAMEVGGDRLLVVSAALRVAMMAAGIHPGSIDQVEAALVAVLMPDLTIDPGEAIH